MIEIDDSMHSGNGTVLRYSTALAALQGAPCASVASTLIPVPQ
jgi:RNA 3'-terminal phosphate cyclase